MILQVIMGTLGSMAVSLLFNIKKKQVLMVGGGTALTWIVYLISQNWLGMTIFEGSLLSAIAVAAYSEIMAIVAKAPATIFLTTSALPLIPGRGLYYTMYSIVNADWIKFEEFGQMTLDTALGIACGFVVVAIVVRYIRRVKIYRKKRKLLEQVKGE